MWRKVAWIFVWTTLAFWYGCSATPNQPYAVHPDANELFPVTPTTSEPLDNKAAKPSIAGLERDNWRPVTVDVYSGAVAHHPVYFTDKYAFGTHWRVTQDRQVALTLQGDIDNEAAAVTAGAYDDDSGGFGDGFWGTMKFALDTAALPYRFIKDPGGRLHYTEGLEKAPPAKKSAHRQTNNSHNEKKNAEPEEKK